MALALNVLQDALSAYHLISQLACNVGKGTIHLKVVASDVLQGAGSVHLLTHASFV